MVVTSPRHKLWWYTVLLRRALRHTDDVEHALLAVSMAMDQQPFPDETEIDNPDDPDDDWREEAEPPGTADGKPVDVTLSSDAEKDEEVVEASGLLATATGDFAPEGKWPKWKASKSKISKGKKSRGSRKFKRRLGRGLRVPRAWRALAHPAPLSLEVPARPWEHYGSEPPGEGWVYAGASKWIKS